MTSATLTFDEESELIDAVNGYKYKLALWELDQFLISELKCNDKLTAEQDEYAELIREMIREFLEDYQLTIE